MSYFIFGENLDNVSGTLYKIAENQSDFNNLNITPSVYKVVEDSEFNFNLVKLGSKIADKYNNNTITYIDVTISFYNKNELQNYVNNFKKEIKRFTDNNPNHPLFNRWNDYYNQLNSLNLNTITYPLNKSLEQYFNDLGQPLYNILQIP
jgi:hypothetical protein